MKKINLSCILALAALLEFGTSPAHATTLTLFQTVNDTDFTSAGVGGIREIGSGTINLTGVSGTVTKAYLYWHGHVPAGALDFNAVGTALFNGNPISGPNLGVSASDGWNFPPFNLVYGQAFRADVTAFVTGNGAFTVSNFSPLGTNVQGASLLVFFDDGNPNNNRDILVYDGVDCNDGAIWDPYGWQLFMHGINVVAGDAVTLQLHVSDGQYRYQDGPFVLNNQTMLPAGFNFEGAAPYNTNGTYNTSFYQGSLWDVNTYDITSFLVPGRNDIVLTTGLLDDDLSLIAAVANFRTGSGVLPPPPANNNPPSITIQDPISVDCVPASGTVQTVSAVVSDVDGDALAVFWTVNGVAVQKDQVSAGGPPTSATVSLTYQFPQGNNTVVASVSDFYSAPVTIQTSVFANSGDFTPPTVDCGPIVQGLLGALGTILTPSVTGQVTASDNCTPTQFLQISQSPAAGTLLGAGTNLINITVTDLSGNSSTCAVPFVVNLVPPPPLSGQGGVVFAVVDAGTTYRNTAVTLGNVLTNDSTMTVGATLSMVSFDAYSKQGGAVAYQGNGLFAYTPAFNFVGTDTFTYTVGDGTGAIAVGTVTVTVLFINHPPVAQADSASTVQSTPVSINVIANHSDPDKDTLTVTTVTTPGHGTVMNNGNGTVTYTPAANFVGVDTFTYKISDGNGGVATATVTVTVISSNHLPVANADASSTPQGTAITVTVLANDTDADGDVLKVTGTTAPGHGTASVNGGLTITYTPASGFFGVDNFSYTISDGKGGTATAIVTITVVPPPPLAVNDSASTILNTPVTIAVLSNDSDPNKLPLSITGLSLASHGSPAVNGSAITYTPAAGFVGTDSFTYTIGNGFGGFSTATVTITISPATYPPVAVNDSATTPVNVPVIISVLANDSDPNHSVLKLVSVTQPGHGSVVTNANGSVIYAPASNFVGTDTFTYTISNSTGGKATATVTVVVVAAPLSLSCVDSAGKKGTPYSAGVTATGGVGPYTYSIASGSLPPGLTLNAKTGAIKGTPTSTGTYTYTLKVVDSMGATTLSQCASGCGASAKWDFLTPTGVLGTSQSYTVDGVRVMAYGYTTSGSATALYGKNAGANETGLGISSTSDHEISTRNFVQLDLTQLIANGARNAALSIGSAQSGEGYTIYGSHVRGSRGTALLTGSLNGTSFPIPSYGTYEFISVSASAGDVLISTLTATVAGAGGCSITITGCTLANDCSATCSYNQWVSVPVLSNCSDSQGHSLKVLSVTQGAHCTASINSDGTVTCRPANGYSGTDSFTCTVTDGHGETCTSKVNVTIKSSDSGWGNWNW